MLAAARKAKSNDVMKLYFECFDRHELLFTRSTKYLYPSKRKQIQPKMLTLTHTDAKTNR